MEFIEIKNEPNADELWSGIGGHFDSLGQIMCEFIDNSISNFTGNNGLIQKNIVISLSEKTLNGDVEIIIEDTGTGIKDLNSAFTLGSCAAAESPLNEHGFGLKHALASANPNNDNWSIYTRTNDDINNNHYKKIEAPYKIRDFKCTIVNSSSEPWPGQFNKSGTLIKFICTREMFSTITRGLRGGITSFNTICDVLCEDLGFIYSGVIKTNGANITLSITPYNEVSYVQHVGVLEPNWDDFYHAGQGVDDYDLGNGKVKIEYSFGKIYDKPSRIEFDNTTARKYYKQNMSSSGVEIRINGRVLCYNLFKEIWGIEKHNSYNSLLVTINLKSDDKNKLPKTRTSKNGLREGDPKLEKLYSWIKAHMLTPEKDMSLADHETDLFETLKEYKEDYSGDPNVIVDVEKYCFSNTGNLKDKVRIDLYLLENGKITIFEGKKEQTTSKDVYQLRMYWDGLVYDGVDPDEGILISNDNPESVKKLVEIVNNMTDAHGNKYKFVCKNWSDYHISFNH